MGAFSRWALFATTMFLIATSLMLAAKDTDPTATSDEWSFVALLTLQAITFAAVGLVIARRRRRDPIAWLFSLVGVFVGLHLATERYQHYALVIRDGDLPLGELMAWLQAWLYVPALGIVVMVLPQLFPTGRPVSKAWSGALWLSAVAFVGIVLTDALAPGRLDQTTVENPLGIDPRLHDVLAGSATTMYLFATLAGFAALVVRWRRANLRQRQQLKWFAYAGSFLPLLVCVSGTFDVLDAPERVESGVTFAVAVAAFLGLPIATAISIVRYQLFAIDVVINRTLVYGALTVLLGAAYLGFVLLLQRALTPVTNESDLAVAGSTLAVAALFRPLRSRVQRVVDRRFYRARYDASRTLEVFSGRLRHELDLEHLGGDLRRVVHDTMQPVHVSLWLRDTP